MTSISADLRSPLASSYPAMRSDNITLPKGSGSALSTILLLAGVVGLGATGYYAFAGGSTGVTLRHVLAAVQIGASTVLAMSLGALFFVMVFHLTNAGWTGTVRKQFENLAALAPLAALFAFLPVGISILKAGGSLDSTLYSWMSTDFAHNVALGKKAGFLNVPFFLARSVAYVFLWTIISQLMLFFSRKYDETGDSSVMARARLTSAPCMVLFALSLAFASFDWLMSTDLEFFSTMWGVWYFSGAALSSVCVVSITFATLRSRGKLEGLVTVEHFHDLGKLMFAFTCFWSYIAFFQYFLIWYANIPEETAWYSARKTPEWNWLFTTLMLGHFGLPFVILITRGAKRSGAMLILMGLWLILMEIVDIYFVVRPTVYAGKDSGTAPGATAWGVDAAGIIGVLGVFGFFYVKRVASRSLVPLRDPRFAEAFHHKNYV